MTKVIKFQAPFERLRAYNEPAVSLYKAVILQALIDATDLRAENTSKQQAVSWLKDDAHEQEFHQVCHDAMLEPEFVRNINTKMSELHLYKSKQRKTHRQYIH
ncbi:hypothetical protein Sarmat_00116 [Rickettsiales endosymbiont of Paramecium tredecaurelia]|uniref:hypothetical protein n=1 Tax=Candidatus Sarmatiella mevalonica TaxID=2770581 RepID=UPI00192365A7|nr:hypothetical protein [Candidatus Sarmatiella mevalonica]MBL3284276.1 hypothetical protein [Candidatus Sarmatiella mevalonica]